MTRRLLSRDGTASSSSESDRIYGASGSTRMIVLPCWSPSHRLERAPDFCTSTWRTLVSCGNRYSVNSPVCTFKRTARSLSIPAVQTYVLSSNCASYGRVHEVGTFHSVIFFVFASNIAKPFPWNTPHHRRSCESRCPRRHPAPLVGKSYQTVSSVLPFVTQILSLFICIPYMLFLESATTS